MAVRWRRVAFQGKSHHDQLPSLRPRTSPVRSLTAPAPRDYVAMVLWPCSLFFLAWKRILAQGRGYSCPITRRRNVERQSDLAERAAVKVPGRSRGETRQGCEPSRSRCSLLLV